MKIKGLDGKEYSWNPTANKKRECSGYHTLARKIIKSVYISYPLLEEVSLPGTKPILYADFLIPLKKIIIEVQGEQHYNWVQQFQPTKKDFYLGKRRDNRKRDWCELNDFTYIELPFWEDSNEWRTRIADSDE